MTSIVFDTPGLIPLEAFTHFGVNAKPSTDNPIGFFGTGLKYAIAVLVREDIPVTVWIGRHRYIFVKDEHKFRDKDFTFIALKRDKGGFWHKVTQLPFTTELGKNWKLWQAFRELYANTLDEKGNIYQTLDHLAPVNTLGTECTRIIVESEAFAEEYRKRDEIFRLDGWEEIFAGVHVRREPSKHIFYRGMRVYDMPKDVHSIYTYNITHPMELTEDRTLAQSYVAEYYIKGALARTRNKQVIADVLAGSAKTYEGRLDFDHVDFVPSEEFRQAIYRPSGVGSSGTVYHGSVRGYVDRVAPEVPKAVDEHELLGALIQYLDDENWYELERLMRQNRSSIRKILRTYKEGLTT